MAPTRKNVNSFEENGREEEEVDKENGKKMADKKNVSAPLNDVIWLIVVAFFFSRGFVKSGLENRVATYFIRWLGRKTVGLAYGLVLSEALVSPAIPSQIFRF